MIYTQLNKPYISLFMIVGGYHGLNTSSGLLQALLNLHWDACVVILSNIESSHMQAGHLWALEPKAMLNYGTSIIYVFFLLFHFIFSQILVGPST